MKIAVTGKGGVGKSTIAAAFALLLSRRGERVLCLDADPDANLASALGVPQSVQDTIAPISKQLDLIAERTGVEKNTYGRVFKLNPHVSDVAERFATSVAGIDLLVLGAITSGGGGCACPESTFVRALVSDLLLYKNETLIMDMEAGVEHLGRATAGAVDVMVVVVEPGKRSIDCARLVFKMAGEIGISRFLLVGNKIDTAEEEAYIRSELSEHPVAAMLPYDARLKAADRDGVSVLDVLSPQALSTLEALVDSLYPKQQEAK